MPTLPDTTPPDYSTTIGQVRLLIPDAEQLTDVVNTSAAAAYLFGDSQITALLALYSNNIKRSAAQAKLILATSEALINKVIRTADYTTDGAKLGAELRAQAADLRAEVYGSVSGDQVYNPATNSFSGSSVPLYIGPARIQPTSNPTDTVDDFNPTSLQVVRVILPLNRNTVAGSDGLLPDIRPNNRVRVTASPYNTALLSFAYEVIGVLNSSNAWERTIICRVNMEIDPTNV
jgi:hypothetical protein